MVNRSCKMTIYDPSSLAWRHKLLTILNVYEFFFSWRPTIDRLNGFISFIRLVTTNEITKISNSCWWVSLEFKTDFYSRASRYRPRFYCISWKECTVERRVLISERVIILKFVTYRKHHTGGFLSRGASVKLTKLTIRLTVRKTRVFCLPPICTQPLKPERCGCTLFKTATIAYVRKSCQISLLFRSSFFFMLISYSLTFALEYFVVDLITSTFTKTMIEPHLIVAVAYTHDVHPRLEVEMHVFTTVYPPPRLFLLHLCDA